MSKELCGAIKFADENVVFDSKSERYSFKDDILKTYCPNQICDGDGKLLGSAFTALLYYFKSIDEEKLEDDKLAQYAILWFNYKITQNTKIEDGINDIYNILIKNNSWFSEHRQYTDKNENVMKIYFSYLNNLYALLKEICNTIDKCSDPSKTSECQESGKKCASLYRSCIISFPWKEICNPYCSVLSNLKKDYDKFRKNHNDKNLPELKPPEGRESCESFCKSKQESKVEEPTNEVSEIVTPTVVSLADPSVTPKSINNGNKLPYIAVPLILIPIILGISYKYLTPVWRKKMKRKTMKKIINLSDQKKA
ncbi:CIR protein [Plasmodium chabaudi chabaudi]|uniref:PIR protein n=1 Tax=Plasmodium chabaudi chabaudi TaxID=31271 RepID=A0A4V0KE34_PLACU|nr:CIR protein [Plasmodium chabaudi chabaudi]VTZ70678.1 CIR protein [Plasmodium chabaudi chabaudi]|eukprot:XP_016654787.1 CIR protein [Plasmodium chabaudi chabaudi]